SIKMGIGNDFIGVGNFDNSGGLVDSAVNSLLGAVTIKNGLSVNMQGGNNTFLAKDATFRGAMGPNLEIIGADGNDSVKLKSVTVAHALTITDNGAMTIDIDGLIANAVHMTLGVGNDNVSLKNSTVNTNLSFDTGFGNDIVT